MSDRGMKKWNAYKTLPEHEPTIGKTITDRYKTDKPIVTDDEAEIINDILVNYKGELLEISYYRNGYNSKIITTIKKIDPIYKILTFAEGEKIYIKDITSIKIKD